MDCDDFFSPEPVEGEASREGEASLDGRASLLIVLGAGLAGTTAPPEAVLSQLPKLDAGGLGISTELGVSSSPGRSEEDGGKWAGC